MTITELDQLTREALSASERNERIARHIQGARKQILFMMITVILMAGSLYYPAEARPFAPVGIAGMALGYSLRAVIGHLRRMRRRQHGH